MDGMVAGETADRPNAGFWEQTLELAVESLVERAQSDVFMDTWINERTAQQAIMLRHLLGLPPATSIRERRAALHDHKDALRPFVPVQEFSVLKHRAAVLDFVRRRLPPEVVALALVGENKHDSAALIYALYQRDWSDLGLLFQIDKVHKSGFARMVLAELPRRGPQRFAEYITGPATAEVLADYDRQDPDGRVSELRGMLDDGESTLLFIRRPERRDLIIQGTTILHGFSPEWIILDFHEAATRVNIASKSVVPSLEIANALASAYYGVSCEYANDRAPSQAQQIRRLLDALIGDTAEGLRLVEIAVNHCPLHAAPKMVLSSTTTLSVAEAIRQIETAFGSLHDNLDWFHSVKVLYHGKRVTVSFDRPDDPVPGESVYVVRYTDHRLSAGERKPFEQFMLSTHGLTIVSTEKRFKSAA